jgi:hypothetical protein
VDILHWTWGMLSCYLGACVASVPTSVVGAHQSYDDICAEASGQEVILCRCCELCVVQQPVGQPWYMLHGIMIVD